MKEEGGRSRNRTPAVALAAAATCAAIVAAAPAGAVRPVGPDVRLSVLGPEGVPNFSPDESGPAIAHNRRRNEYLAVFPGVDGASNEVFGQRISASGGRLGPTFQISADGDFSGEPAIAYNSHRNQYLVAYVDHGLVAGEEEIVSQLLSAQGQPIGPRHRVSEVGPAGDPQRSASLPSIAYNPRQNQFLVAFGGDDQVLGALEIHAQRLSASNGDLGGDFRVSNATDVGADRQAFAPSVAHNSRRNQYLVVFEADSLGPDDDFEVLGQRLTAAGGALGGDFRISSTNAAGRVSIRPAVAYNPVDDQYLVAFVSDRLGPQFYFEVFVRRLSSGGARLGGDVRVSRVRDRNPTGSAGYPAVIYGPTAREYLVAWEADGLAVDNEFEIFAQRVARRGRLLDRSMRVSRIGPPGPERGAFAPALAARERSSQYLSAFTADGLATDNDYEIFGRLLSAPRCGGRLATLTGTRRRDAIAGTGKRDVIAGLGGRDRLRGRGGNDVLCGGRGPDRLLGGRGRDRLFGGRGRDRLLGGRGPDRLLGGPGVDVCLGGPGRDRLRSC